MDLRVLWSQEKEVVALPLVRLNTFTKVNHPVPGKLIVNAKFVFSKVCDEPVPCRCLLMVAADP